MYEGVDVEVLELRGGFSGTKTLLVRVTDATGALRARGVMKIGSLDQIEDESTRYATNVPAILGEGVFVPRADVIRAGAAGRGAVVFTFADDHSDLYVLLNDDEGAAVGTIDLLVDRLQPWLNGAESESHSVGEVRATLVTDEELGRIEIPDDVPVQELERLEIEVRSCIQHGDLHGANLLVDRGGNPKLIDFGRTGRGPACLDALTLELSLVFHPRGRDMCLPWPSVEQVAQWPELDAYVQECPCEAFVRRARSWALTVCGSAEEVLATAYALGCRQLLFEDTDSDKAVVLIRACASHLLRERDAEANPESG
jgi:hypothetical protein